MKKHFQHLQALLGARWGLPLRHSPARRFLVLVGVAALATAFLSAQAPEASAQDPSNLSPTQVTPALPEPPLPPLAEAAQPSSAPLPSNSPPEEAVLLEAQPVSNAPSATNITSSPPTPPAPPQSSPAKVNFATPAAQATNEPVVAIGRPVSRTNYGPEGNRKAAQLRSMPPERFTFDRAFLRDVLRLLGEQAGIPYVGIPEGSALAQQLVTFQMTASPFAALESVARQYSIDITFQDGVWAMRLPDTKRLRQERLDRITSKEEENELVGVMYQLHHDSADRVEFRSDLLNPGGQADNNNGIPVGGQLGGVSTPNLPLQNSQKVFVRSVPRVVNDIRSILGLPPLAIDQNGNIREDFTSAGGAIVDLDRMRSAAEFAMDSESSKATAGMDEKEAISQRVSGGISTAGGALSQPDTVTPLYVPPERPQVIYNSDMNFIWVVATRKQHRWVAEYLSRVDKPQDLIAIEVKFLETKKNPQIDIGINWQDTFGSGLTVSGGASVGSADQPIGGLYFGDTRVSTASSARTSGNRSGTLGNDGGDAGGGNQTSVENVPMVGAAAQTDGSGNFNGIFRSAQQGVTGAIPYSAVLSLDQFSFTLQAFMQDRDTSIVQYPRVLTLNNREVAITSSENTPVNAGTSDVGGSQGGATQTVGSLAFLPIGTQINILPKVVNRNQIAMTVAITVSSIIGVVPINLGTGANNYPITSERVFNASLQVDSGYTLAVGGLEKVDDKNTTGGIPLLQDIPGLGYLFKNKNKQRDKVNLIIFITPYLIGDPSRTPGISETPKSILPVRPGVPPDAPVFTTDGRISGGESGVLNAFAWLEFQLDYFRQVNLEAMMSNDSIRKLRDVIGVARALLADLQLEAGEPPYSQETQAGRNALRAEELLTDLNRVLAVAQENLM